MADKNQMDQGSAVPPRLEKEAERGVSRARKAAEDLSSAAGVTAEKYRPRGKVWDDALHRVRSFQDALGVGFVLGLLFRRLGCRFKK